MEAISTAAIDRVLSLAPAVLLEVDGFTHIDKDKSVTLFTPPTPTALDVTTLSGFVQLLEDGFEGFDATQTIVRVAAFDEVHLVKSTSDKYGRRQVYVKAKALKPERSFSFNQYVAQEEFVIALRSMFVQTPDLDALVAVSGNLAAKAEVKQEDDGITQNVTVKAGVHRLSAITVTPRVTLQPFRTFLEVDQPTGDFIFRVKYQEGLGNLCALFEADAGRWKLTAMNTIQTWLQNRLRGSEVTAVNNISVVA